MPKKLTTDEFIRRSKLIHGEKYNYSKSIYMGGRTKIIIICSVHGEFSQTAERHLFGCGCRLCNEYQKKTTEQFIDECKKIHGNKYDYSQVEYKGDAKKVMILCKIHGAFYQRPKDHIRHAQGCPNCSSRISKSEAEFLDVFGITRENRQYRIPKTNYEVDGIDKNCIYEYLGDYWHGNPKIYPSDKFISKSSKTTFGELYQRTIDRFNRISYLGYKIKFIWENDWKSWKKNKEKKLRVFEYKNKIP